MADEHVSGIKLKAVFDGEKNKVIFVESDGDFVDVLLSFLTIPISTIITLAQNQSLPSGIAGCIKNLYKSVQDIDVRYFHLHSEAGKLMLLHPRNAAESCNEGLKLKIDNAECTKYFCCASNYCTYAGSRLLSHYKDSLCECRKPMNREVKLVERVSEENGGIFVNRMTMFLITDELQVVPMSTAATFSLFAKHGITDDSNIKEINFNVGEDEILMLLVGSLVTRTPFTQILLKNKAAPPSASSSLNPISSIESPEEEKSKKEEGLITVKLIVSKSKKIVCYAEANKDFVNLIFSFLTIPLGYVAQKVSGGSFRGCIDQVYKTVHDLDDQFFKSKHQKEILVNPRLAFGFTYRNDLLDIEEASHQPYIYENYYSLKFCAPYSTDYVIVTDRSLIESTSPVFLTAINSKAHYKDSNENEGGILSGSTLFTVTDNLILSPMSSSSCLAILKGLKVPFSDIEEKVVHVGRDEAVKLLLSSFVSGSALTNTFIRKPN